MAPSRGIYVLTRAVGAFVATGAGNELDMGGVQNHTLNFLCWGSVDVAVTYDRAATLVCQSLCHGSDERYFSMITMSDRDGA